MLNLVTAATIGAQPIQTASDKQRHQLGDTYIGNHNSYTYVKAGSDLASAAATALTGYVTSSGTGYTTDVAVKTGQFFWLPKTASPV